MWNFTLQKVFRFYYISAIAEKIEFEAESCSHELLMSDSSTYVAEKWGDDSTIDKKYAISMKIVCSSESNTGKTQRA